MAEFLIIYIVRPKSVQQGRGKAGSGGSGDPLKFGAEVRNCICLMSDRCQSNGNDQLTTCLTLIH